MRAIDADALVKELKRPSGLYADCERCSWSISNECMDCIVEDVIKCMPTIDPVKHGHWIDDGDCFICSNCRKAFGFLSAKCVTNFCPYCGAKMESDKNDIN